MIVGEFLRVQCGNRAPWHCSTLAADWCIVLGHPDFAAAWRNICESSACDAASAEADGLVNLWNDGIGLALLVVDAPYRAGDIAVIAAMGLEAGAIWTGERWAARSQKGLAFLAADRVSVLKAWRP